MNSGAKLLQDVIHDLEDVVLICQVFLQSLLLTPVAHLCNFNTQYVHVIYFVG